MQPEDQSFLDAVLDASDAVIFVTDRDGRIARCNETFGRITGIKPSDAVGRLLWSLDPPPRDPESLQGVIQLVLRFRQAGRVENVWQAHGKGPRNFEWTLSPLLGEAGRVTHVVAVGIDVTDQRRAEKKAREADERFRAFFDNAPVGKSMTSVDGRLLRVNAAFCSMLGYSSDEMQSKGFQDITHPDDLEATRELVRSVVSGERDANAIEKRFLAKDGHVVWALVQTALQRDADGHPLFLLTHILDITQRKHAEAEHERLQQKVQQERDRLSTLVNSIVDEVWFADTDGNFTLANPAARREFGDGDVDGTPVQQYLSRMEALRPDGTVHPTDQAPLLRALKGEVVANQEVLVRTPASSEMRSRLVSASPVRDSRGAIVGAVCVVRDVTTQRQTEQLMQRAQKLESVGLLAGGIAHDFNNLLAGILGNAVLAHADVPAGGEADRSLSQIQAAIGRAQDLTGQLLAFSKGGTPVRRVMHVGGLVRESAQFSVRGTNSRCEVDVPDALWPVEADEGQISQVVSNLVVNAVESMPAGGTVRVSVRNVPAGKAAGLPDGPHVEIVVQDEGCGVPPELVSRIFDPYVTTKKNGSGLGLATSSAIVRKHGGAITLDTAPGMGSRFRVFLPASAKEPEAPALDGDAVRLQGRILVMDDDESILDVCCRMLVLLGCEAEPARDGREAIRLYQAAAEAGHPFDAVILDLTVPSGMGGKAALEALLTIDPAVRAIVSSGYPDDPILANFRAHGFSGMMPKPFQVATLRRALGEVLPAAARAGS